MPYKLTSIEKALLALLVIGLLVLLTACGPKPPVHVAFPRPPADKLVCDEEPGRPGTPGQSVTDEQAGRYMQDLRGSGQSCRDDVQWLHDWFAKLTG